MPNPNKKLSVLILIDDVLNEVKKMLASRDWIQATMIDLREKSISNLPELCDQHKPDLVIFCDSSQVDYISPDSLSQAIQKMSLATRPVTLSLDHTHASWEWIEAGADRTLDVFDFSSKGAGLQDYLLQLISDVKSERATKITSSLGITTKTDGAHRE